jgi:hypothetical protein
VINLFNPKPHFTSKHEGYWTKLTSEARTRKAEEPVFNLQKKKKKKKKCSYSQKQAAGSSDFKCF